MLESLFKLSERETNVKTEVLAGVTTFLTMAYIIFVNPSILKVAGMPEGAVFVATCLAAAIGSLIMGLYANFPVGLAPGMGMNAFVTFGVVLGMGLPWQTALGMTFISGLIFLGVSLTPLREHLINAIPKSLKLAIGAGIGFFLALIGLKNAGIVVDHQATLVGLGDLAKPEVLLAILGFFVISALYARRVPGAVIIGVILVSVLGIIMGYTAAPSAVFSAPPSIAETFLAMDLKAAFSLTMVALIFTMFMADMFDSTGTLVSVGQGAGWLQKDGKLPGIRKALVADSAATVAGAALGVTTTTAYIESLSGIKAGGRTGLTAVTIGVLFLACLFLAPLAGAIPAYATAPALVFVACLMASGTTGIDWEDTTEYVPAVVAIVAIPLTFNITYGIGFGFIAYTAIKVIAGRVRDVTPMMYVLTSLFVIDFYIR